MAVKTCTTKETQGQANVNMKTSNNIGICPVSIAFTQWIKRHSKVERNFWLGISEVSNFLDIYFPDRQITLWYMIYDISIPYLISVTLQVGEVEQQLIMSEYTCTYIHVPYDPLSTKGIVFITYFTHQSTTYCSYKSNVINNKDLKSTKQIKNMS